ncbi:MAG: alpha/beta fold hydrolase [Alphaproteobacteria bacterium]|nr:alpha/beta fold hydrolase [Alphaproteobacteria bacterium]
MTIGVAGSGLKVAMIAGLLCLGATTFPGSTMAGERSTALKRHSFTYSGERRHFWIHAPPGARPGGTPLPLLFALHGWTETGIGFAARTQFHRLAARRRFVVAYPYGRAGRWHMAVRPAGAPDDDIGLIRALAKLIDTRIAAVDRKRIHAVGFSMGGVLSLRLACEASDLMAGVVAVSATLPVKLAPGCMPSRPVSVLLIHGTLDPISPFPGGLLVVVGQPTIRLLSVEGSAGIFARAMGCAAVVRGHLRSVRSPGARLVRRWHYPGCSRGRVEAWALPGQGHAWPRTMIDATTESWHYLAQTAKRAPK